jgi:hypothetical protein
VAAEPKQRCALDQHGVPDVVLEEPIRRIRDIEAAGRDVAKKLGQLTCADRHDLASLTRESDPSLRNAFGGH